MLMRQVLDALELQTGLHKTVSVGPARFTMLWTVLASIILSLGLLYLLIRIFRQ